MKTTYTAEINIWSAIGNTPKTGRKGAFCDLLVKTQIQCESPSDAIVKAREIMEATPHADKAHYYMPGYPNQNERSKFFHAA